MDLLGKPLQWAAALAVVATVIGAKAALRRRRRETRRPTVAPMGELKRRTLDGTVVPLSGTGLRPPAPSHAETFAHESDLELVYALAARIDERERGVGWDGLTSAERLVSAVFRLEAEVTNGGYEQYVWNTAPGREREALAGLETLGAARRRDVLRQVLAAFGPDGPARGWAERQAQLERDGRRLADLLSDLDRVHWATDREEDLLALLARFARAHRDDFTA